MTTEHPLVIVSLRDRADGPVVGQYEAWLSIVGGRPYLARSLDDARSKIPEGMMAIDPARLMPPPDGHESGEPWSYGAVLDDEKAR